MDGWAVSAAVISDEISLQEVSKLALNRQTVSSLLTAKQSLFSRADASQPYIIHGMSIDLPSD